MEEVLAEDRQSLQGTSGSGRLICNQILAFAALNLPFWSSVNLAGQRVKLDIWNLTFSCRTFMRPSHCSSNYWPADWDHPSADGVTKALGSAGASRTSCSAISSALKSAQWTSVRFTHAFSSP